MMPRGKTPDRLVYWTGHAERQGINIGGYRYGTIAELPDMRF